MLQSTFLRRESLLLDMDFGLTFVHSNRLEGVISLTPSNVPHLHAFSLTLPLLPVTALDIQRRHWVSILSAKDGIPGFIEIPDGTTLTCVAKLATSNPIHLNIHTEAAGRGDVENKALVAGMGIELRTRTRIQVSGCISSLLHDKQAFIFWIAVTQAVRFVSPILHNSFLLNQDLALSAEFVANHITTRALIPSSPISSISFYASGEPECAAVKCGSPARRHHHLHSADDHFLPGIYLYNIARYC